MEFQRLLEVWLLESNTPVGRVHADHQGVLFPILRTRTTGFSHRVGVLLGYGVPAFEIPNGIPMENKSRPVNVEDPAGSSPSVG